MFNKNLHHTNFLKIMGRKNVGSLIRINFYSLFSVTVILIDKISLNVQIWQWGCEGGVVKNEQ